jgi:periplasmic protein CpxP/Spy
MTLRTSPYIAGFLLASGIALALPAQAHPGPGFGAGMHEMRGGHGAGEFGTMRLFRRLELTEAQRDQVFKIFHEQAPALREKMRAVRQAREALREAASAPTFDSARVRELADAQGRAIADAAVMRAETMSRVVALLTPEQRAKLDEVREKGPRRGRP